METRLSAPPVERPGRTAPPGDGRIRGWAFAPDRLAPRSEADPPVWTLDRRSRETQFDLSGTWTADQAATIETLLPNLVNAAGRNRRVLFDLSRIARLDTAGAWLLDRTWRQLATGGDEIVLSGASDEHRILIEPVDRYDVAHERPPAGTNWSISW